MGKDNKMNKIVMTKKELLALVLAFTMAATPLTGCKKNTESTMTSETTTVMTSVEPTTTTKNDDTVSYIEEATKLYEANKDFFVNQYGENKEYAIKEINDVLLIIKNNSKTITNEDLSNALYAMDNMFMPTNVIQAAGNYVTEEEIAHVENIPSLGQYVEDKQAQTIINENTALINNFIDKMNNGTAEEREAAKKLLLQRVVLVEENLDEYYYLGELSNGDELALNMSMKGLINLAGSLLENGVLYYTDKNGVDQTKPLIPDAYGAIILNDFRLAEQEGTPYDTKEIKDGDGVVTVQGRYVDIFGERKFVSLAEKNLIEDILAITKYDEAILYLENEYSRISSEYYSLNGNCDNKTLTK
ncbi:MAG: hypothetical protein IKZ96_01420 [Bacilli bacterium]|nr:hypothetical protein [Bacilli bacterium]